jgi:glyoxylase-like metal-dependent hydrolase (beta-lactamase superfamily II)
MDGTNVYTAERYFPGVPLEVAEPELRRFGDTPERILSPYTCMAIRDGDGWILIDTGAGTFAPTTGRLRDNLAAAGIPPEDIRVVVITHAHPDHVGGNLDQAGRPSYPNARWVISKEEWDFWTSDAAMRDFERFAVIARQQLLPIKDRFHFTEGEAEVAPGVAVIPAGGHTPGQTVVAVTSGGEELLYISDVVLHPLHLEHPDWQPIYDMERERARQTTRRVFDRAADRGSIVLAFHFAFPSLGQVSRLGQGWRWEAVAEALASESSATAPGR